MHIAIVGGGAAGLMAAAAIQETNPDVRVTLLERNPELGKKVVISGGGRCNLTTGVTPLGAVLESYPRGRVFIEYAMRRFPPQAVVAWFEAHGVPLKTEKDLRVFPQSDDGKSVVRVFEKLFQSSDSNVRVLLRRQVTGVKKSGRGFALSFKDGESIEANRLVLTTGGQAYRQTGSTGDGYAFAESLGHTVTALAPSLNSFFTAETWPKELSGLSIAAARLSSTENRKKSNEGPFLFTHRGVSGPAVFALSALVAFEKFDPLHPLMISIDLFPAERLDALAGRLANLCRTNGKKSLKTVLGFALPKALAGVLVRAVGADEGMQAAQATKKLLTACAAWTKTIPLSVVGRGAGDEFVTAGGVETAEVNPRTMESRRTPGLFFAGEILNVDGFTGGFNLQSSWATGRLAGECAAATG